MIDIRALREDPEAVKAALARRGVESSEVEAVLEADEEWRAKVKTAEDLRAEVKALSKQIAEAKKAGDEARAGELSARSRALGDDERAAAVEVEVNHVDQIRVGALRK